MKKTIAYRALGIAGIIAFLAASSFEYYAMIPDAPRDDFKTKAEKSAYEEGWKRGELHIALQKDIYDTNSAIYKYSLLALSVMILAVSIRRKKEPNQSLQTTIMAVTDAAAQPPRQP